MTVQLGPMPPVAAGLQPNEPTEARAQARAGIDRPPFSAAASAETARAVEPPPGLTRAAALPDRDLPPLIPPDPQAPAGPPPAFEASILDRARERAAEPAAIHSQPAPRGEPSPAARADEASPYQVPPSSERRAEVEVATVRRFETPYDTSTVDVSR